MSKSYVAVLVVLLIAALLGMAVFRHKTRHTSFRVLFPLFTILNIGAAAALILLASKGGLP